VVGWAVEHPSSIALDLSGPGVAAIVPVPTWPAPDHGCRQHHPEVPAEDAALQLMHSPLVHILEANTHRQSRRIPRRDHGIDIIEASRRRFLAEHGLIGA